MTLQQLFPVLRDEHGMKMWCACGCGRRARHIHHIIAQCRGGSDEPSNRMAVCQKCHVSIHSKQGDFAQWGKMGGAITAQKKVSIPNLVQFRGEAGAVRFQAWLDRQANAQMGWAS
jgi:hypothetical protein